MDKKREYGQYFTKQNPFSKELFEKWVAEIEKAGIIFNELTILEPFAGNCDLIKHVSDIGGEPKWDCFDIAPIKNEIQQRDTLDDFPENYIAAITNPPYLAKNSAKRRKIDYPPKADLYPDIYMYALERALLSCDYVIAIIPESFTTQNLFHSRIMFIDSRTTKLFEDTDVPVCVVYFIKGNHTDFELYRDGKYIDTKNRLREYINTMGKPAKPFKFNNPNGILGLHSIDGTKSKIRFVHGDEIPSSKIKVSSRAYTRIDGIPKDINLDELIRAANKELEIYRKETADLLLTSFKGTGNDGKYRRRLSWDQCTLILNKAICSLTPLMRFPNE